MNLKTPIELFGIECGRGWEKLYMPIIQYIEEYNKNKEEDQKIHIIQIKEKYSQLRFYTNFVTTELNKMIGAAKDKSWNVCESCGSETYVGHTNNHISVCCIDCLKEQLGKRFLKHLWTSHTNDQTYIINEDSIDKVLKNIKN